MQNQTLPTGFVANSTNATNGENDWQINPFDIFSSSHYSKTTKSAFNIKCNHPWLGVSSFFKCISWLVSGQCEGIWSVITILICMKNSWYCLATMSSKGLSFRSCTLIALLISYSDAWKIVDFPFFTIPKVEDCLGITIVSRNVQWGYIFDWNILTSREWTGSGSTSGSPGKVPEALWPWVMQYCDPKVDVFDTNRTATSLNCNWGIPRIIG